MSFEAASLVATIRMDGAEKVGRDLSTVRGRLNDTDGAFGKIRNAAKSAWDTAAVGVGTTVTAVSVLTAGLFSAGVGYNQLQQTSRAALRTLLGGAEQANAQMDKLDAFARNSPFSKSTFISAQQQLIGFGFEAEKVIPILGAVQDAVAAVGGSNQQIGEIVSILAKIRSSGKLTAEDLNMLGERGLDAATLLGQGFGKTAAEIRESITDGTLDAGQAIDVLTTQMGTKFAGAASNVKDTFAGTTDRIKAASRDIGAALAEPFVSKNGGGQAVIWGNQVADVMRAVESHVAPVVTILMSRATPAVNGVTDALDRARVQVRAWDSSRVEQGLESIGENGPAIAAVAGAILGVNNNLLRGLPVVGSFVPAIGPLPGILAGIVLASPEVRSALGDVLGEMRPLIPVAVSLAGVVSNGLNAALPVTADGIRLVAGVAGPLVDVLASIPSPVLATVAATVAVTGAMRSGAPVIQTWLDTARRVADQVAVQSALAGMTQSAAGATTGLGAMNKAAEGANKSAGLMPGIMGAAGRAVTAAFVTNPVGLIILGVSTAAAILTAAFMAQSEAAAATKDRVTGYAEALDQTTGAILRTTRAHVEKNLADRNARGLAEELKVSYNDLTNAILGQPDALERVKSAIEENGAAYSATTGVRNGYTVNAQELIKILNEESSALQQGQADLRQQAEDARKNARSLDDAARSNSRFNEALGIMREVGRDATEKVKGLNQALDELRGGTRTQADAIQALNERGRDLADVLSAARDAGQDLNALVLPTGEIDTATAAGSRLRDTIKSVSDEMKTSMIQAQEESEAQRGRNMTLDETRELYGQYADKVRGVAKEAGLSDEAVDRMTQTMLGVPEVLQYLITSDGTVDAETQRVLNLAGQILATPNGSFEVTEDDIGPLTTLLQQLGIDILGLPEGTVRVKKDDGSITTVEDALNNVARDRTAYIRLVTTTGLGGVPVNQPPPGISKLEKAGGGPVWGAGTSTSDSIHAMLSNDEHVWTASEVRSFGGHGEMMRLRAAVRSGQFTVPAFRDGGAVRLRSELLPPSAPIQLRSTSRAAYTAEAATSAGGQTVFHTEFSGPMYAYDPHDLMRKAEDAKAMTMAVHGLYGKN
ncbi:tape measure protein [Microbacterium sp. Leaf151]|uniref:tape measure protein n=1 Tax=Microbacterium sp. Leaf151 TaxID=1736276 RepID=UPI0006F4FF68|nr:tape measure protein [Microbacterium sp. Leaf151]KQR23173.1 hypothetical protein ASF76_08075 [Microbacterium sp. Leaf151]